MSNYFSNLNNNYSKKRELREALNAIRIQEEAEREQYLGEVRTLLVRKPGLTAQQYANMLSNDPEERNSIAASISLMGYMAENARKYNYDTSNPRCVCHDPSIINMTRERGLIKRRFMEVDENNNPLGVYEVEQYRTTYGIKK